MTRPAVASGIYSGVVTHRRSRPRVHALRYRIFMLLIDLDEAPGLFQRLRFLTARRFGLMTLRLSDFGDRSATPLRDQIAACMREAGFEGGGPVRLMTMPRILGYGFNPLTLFFCHAPDGRLTAILYEVSNTFGQRHSYLMPVDSGDGPVRQTAAKQFHVSPFMDMALTYRFVVSPPVGQVDEIARIAITVEDDEGPMLVTAFAGRRAALTDAQLMRAWITHPLLTFKVIAGIHWEAVKLLLKGVRLRPEPPAPLAPVTVGRRANAYGDIHA